MRTLRVKCLALAVVMIGLILVGCASQPETQPTTASSPPIQKRTAITEITTSRSAQSTDVIIAADGPLTFSSLKQPDPLAVVLYFPQTSADKVKVAEPEDNALIKEILTQENTSGHTTRVEIQLAADASYTAQQTANGVTLAFDNGSITRNVASSSQGTQNEPAATHTTPVGLFAAQDPPASKPTAMSAAAPQPVTSSQSQKGLAWVNKVEFLNETDGRSTLVVGTTAGVDYRINKVSPQKIDLRLLNTKIPSYRQRPLITTRFASAVDRITPYQPSKESAESIIAIELREPVPFVVDQTGNMLMVHFEASSIPPKPMEQAQLPDWKKVMTAETGQSAQAAEPAETAMETVPAITVPSATQSEVAAEDQLIKEDIEIRSLLTPQKRRYTGEKIALDFYDTDIKNVFRILREVSGKNFAIDKDVTGKVTMTLDKPVPWDQVLDLVLRMNQLGMTQEGDIVRIATLGTLKTEEDLRQAKLEALRKAREDAKALEPLITRYIPVSYSSAESEVKPHIEKILTPERGSVTVDAKNNQVIITDTVAKVRQAEEIVRRIDKVTAQVVIEARVVEVSNTFSKELGITWDTSYGPGVIPGLEWANTTDMAMNFPAAGANSSIGISFSRLAGVPYVLNARLNALETNGEGRILSAPKILTLDNKKASIKQGVEYPYQERDSSGGSSVKFKNIDLLLEVTPHVTPDNRISLALLITKNDVAGLTQGVPSVSTNEAKTELLVNDGDTVVIGGIIKTNVSTGKSAFPGLYKIPILGWLFQSNKESDQSNELLIFITPRIVQLEQEMAQAPEK
jgi:type IV pilus assembly protein PilQ